MNISDKILKIWFFVKGDQQWYASNEYLLTVSNFPKYGFW